MRALVTGGGGFLGAHLVTRLAADGWDVVVTVRPGPAGPGGGAADEAVTEPAADEALTTPTSSTRMDALGVAREVHIVAADLADPTATAAVAEHHYDVVFLLAAARDATTAAARAATAAVNGTSNLWLVDALPDSCRAVVRVGSSTEYGARREPMDERSALDPRGFFGATKAAGSLLAVAAAGRRGIRSVVLRPFQVYGPLDHPGRLVPRALRAARSGEVLPLTAPGLRRDWVFVDDVVEACVSAAAADHLPSGQVLNVGTGRQVSNEDLVAEVEWVSGRTVNVDVGAHPGRAWDTTSWVCDPSLARDLLGWEAKVALDEGLARCWRAEDR